MAKIRALACLRLLPENPRVVGSTPTLGTNKLVDLVAASGGSELATDDHCGR